MLTSLFNFNNIEIVNIVSKQSTGGQGSQDSAQIVFRPQEKKLFDFEVYNRHGVESWIGWHPTNSQKFAMDHRIRLDSSSDVRKRSYSRLKNDFGRKPKCMGGHQ